MLIEFLNYQPFYYLIPIRIFHIISIVLIWYLTDQTNGLFELRPFYWKNKKILKINSIRPRLGVLLHVLRPCRGVTAFN